MGHVMKDMFFREWFVTGASPLDPSTLIVLRALVIIHMLKARYHPPLMALNSLCADVPLSNYSLTQSLDR